MMTCKSCRKLECTFFVFIVVSAMFLLALSGVYLQETNFHFREYLRDRRQEYKREDDRWEQTEERGSQVERTTWNEVTSTDNPDLTTDPPWLSASFQQLQPFVTNQSHPFGINYAIENPDACGNDSVDLLILIQSLPSNFNLRRAVRETWAATNVLHGVNIQRVFLLGSTDKNEMHQLRINSEQAAHGDIVQGRFKDSTTNTTIKAVMGLEWVNRHCPQTRFVLKADDNVFVNIFAVMEQVLAGFESNATRTFLCHTIPANTSAIERNPKHKWYVAPDLLKDRLHWPTYCLGYFVLLTPDIVPALYEASFNATYVYVEDAFVYGILPEKEGSDIFSWQDLQQNLTQNANNLLQQYSDLKRPLTFVAGPVRNENDMNKLWRATLARLSIWAQQRARVTRFRRQMGHVTL